MIKIIFRLLMCTIICFTNDVYTTQYKTPVALESPKKTPFWLLQDDTSDLVHIKIAFKNCGAAHLTGDKRGAALLYSLTAITGTKKFSKLDLHQICSDNAISLECNTSTDFALITLTCHKSVLKTAEEVLTEILAHPTFDEEHVNREQQYIDEPQITQGLFLKSKIYPSHPYKYGTAGKPEDFYKLTVDDIKQFHKQFIVRKNAQVFISGNTTKTAAANLIDRILSQLPDGEPAPDKIEDTDITLSSDINHIFEPGEQSTIHFVLRHKMQQSPQHWAAVIMHHILGDHDFMQNRLFSHLRSKLGLIYGGSTYTRSTKHSKHVTGYISVDVENVNKVIPELKKLIKEMKDKGISAEELSIAKQNMLGSQLVSLHSSAAIASYYFSQMLKGNSVNILQESIDAINKVTVEEVNAVAKDLLDPDQLCITIFGGDAS